MAQGKRVKKNSVDPRLIAIIAVASVIVLILGLILGMGIYVKSCDTIFPNVTVAGVKVGGMTYDQAHSTLMSAGINVPSGISASAVLTSDITVTVSSEQAGLASSVSEYVEAAYGYGRSGNFFSNMVSYIRCMRGAHDVYNERIFNEEGVRAIIAERAASANHGAVNGSYTVTDNEIILVKGADGYTVDEEGVYKFIRSTLLSGVSATTDEFSEAKTASSFGDAPDFDKIYEDIFTEPANSVYDPATKSATADVVGVSFDLISARRLFDSAAPGETIRVPLVKTEPEITQAALSELLFRDKIAERMTDMYTSTSNRITNITIAAAAVNGLVLNPGDEFSFNEVVGKRTAEKGYKPAGAYVGGKSVDEIGGGICQVSSTLYYCALMSDLEILDRSNHMFSVAYLPLGLDATVSWGSIDFKFKNNTNYPIEIRAWVEKKELYVEFWGSKVDENSVELISNLIETIGYETVMKVDPTLAPGETKVDTSGHSGYVSEAYKVIKDADGKVISRTFLSRDTYRKQDRVILVAPDVMCKEQGHVWDTGVDTLAPTCGATGIRTYTCTVCGETREETLPATGQHNFVDGKCTVCGAPDPDAPPAPPVTDPDDPEDPSKGGEGGSGDGGDGGSGEGDSGEGDPGEGDPGEEGGGDGTVG